MPITIKTGTMKYKDQNGNYNGFNAIAQEGTEEQLAQITAKGQEVLESIPEDYTELSSDVGELKSALNQSYFPYEVIKENMIWEVGTLDGTTGQPVISPKRLRSSPYIIDTVSYFYFDDASYSGTIFYYSDAACEHKTGDEDLTTSPHEIEANKYFRIRIGTASSNITDPKNNPIYQSISIKNDNNYASKNYVKSKIAENENNFATESYVNAQISNAPFSPVITDDVTIYELTKQHLSYEGNFYPNGIGNKTALPTQYWYQITAKNDFHVWCDAQTAPDIIVALYNNNSATTTNFVGRYRTDDNNLPTENSKLSVTSGQLLVFSVAQDSSFTFNTDGTVFGAKFKDNIFLNNSQIKEVSSKIEIKCEEGKYTIGMNGYTIPIVHTVNAETRADLWNIQNIKKGDTVVCPTGTDIVGVLQETGEADFMGGVHGDETNVNFYILADGVPVTTDVLCEQVDIIMYSHLTRVSTGDNIIDRFVHIIFKNGKIDVYTAFKCLVNNFSLNFAYCGGMFAWYNNAKTFAMCDVGLLNASGSTAQTIYNDKSLRSATVIIDDACATCENLVGYDAANYYGEAYYYGNEQNPRMKIYFTSDAHSTWNTGHICAGKARYTLA